MALLFGLGGPLATAQQAETSVEREEFQIGILATEGATRALEAWQATADLLNAAADEQKLPYRFTIQPQTHGTLYKSIEDQSVDMLLTDPASFVAAEVEYGARSLLSMAHMWEDRAYDMTGALVFVRSDTAIRSLEQLEGRKVMAVAQNDFSGWWLAEQEFRKHRLEPSDILGDLVFSGGNEREVIYAVQSGLVDAGVVRAGILESLARKGVVDIGDFAPVGLLAHSEFPYWASTPLYPEWVMSALPGMPEDALALTINTLLSVTPSSPASISANGAVWQAPQNYHAVHDLLISLRARPYENYIMQAVARIFRTYRWTILGVLALSLVSLAFLVYELRRNVQLAEEQRDVLQSEVRSKKFYRSAIEEHTVFCMLNKDGVISHVNERFIKASERTRQGLVDRPLRDLLNENDQTLLEDEIMSSMELGVSWAGPLKLTREDGSAAWIQCTFVPVTSTSDQLSEVAIVATDVTKTRKGASEARFQNTLELIQDQVFVMRPGSFELLHANEAAERTLSRRSAGDDWRGKKASDLITEDDFKELKTRADAIIAGPQRRMTWETEAKGGITYEISLEYAEPEQDEPRLIAIYRDITERKVAEKAKNEFIATVSHELRTPLTSMKGALGLALSGNLGEMPEKMNKLVTMANTNCDRLVMLINDILDLEKIEAGKMEFNMESFDLRDLVSAALEANQFYADKFGVKFRSDVHEEDRAHLTLGDVGRLRQVMDNLMSNAAKFSPKGEEIIVSLYQNNGCWRISVRDFGSGIPKNAQDKIFDKFSQADSSDTRSQGGTGLGLAIVKQIVESHDGRIFFVSEEGTGTEFYVDLPRMDGESLVAIPAEFSHDDEAVFSALREEEAVAVGSDAEHAVNQLLRSARKLSGSVEVELGRVNAMQVAKGRGVLSQSSILNWLSADGRSLLSELIERSMMENREAMIVEVALEAAADGAKKPTADEVFPLAHEWLAGIKGEAEGEEAKINCILISGNPVISDWAKEQGYMVVDDALQAVSLAEQEDHAGDAIALYHEANNTSIVTIFPLQGGKLPEGLPLSLVVARGQAPQAERGVVSKFTSTDGGGRGRARRRNTS
ncbi:ATP-binding protein [Shimia sp. CNT1-13L.2]|uniref:ATP-binding protein n=1 Tax=Shimia sp. CNT1-13L.2 TaxID=2959663 RepID=UPI0020CBE77E|nr:ATP-binding protein [Shimia sp. CNT1-13L.2]MCP9481098.1 ATP-binding protein [Shimia sp. CNT1-13L.2]